MSVSNDLYTDPRVDKMCNTLSNMGFEVILTGCRHRKSPTLAPRKYRTKRLSLLFQKGSLFYAELNIRLFFYLLFRPCDILVANDLDTLLPNYLVSKIRNKKLVYDSHEYFCQMVTIIHRPFVRKMWHSIERFCFPKLKHVITVSPSIAEAYQKEYGVDVKVVRNIPPKGIPEITETRHTLALPEDKMIILMQGNDISPNRGGEELLEAMPHVAKEAVLLFVGKGHSIDFLKKRTEELNLQNRVYFVNRVTPEKLFNYTYLSDIGVSLEKATSLNQAYSLPNKIFEYMKAGTPVLVSNLPERKAIVNQYQIGEIAEDFEPQTIASALNRMISDNSLYQTYKENCSLAKEQLNWENEEKVIREVYSSLSLFDTHQS